MGVVYEAVQESLGRRVAVKVRRGRISAAARARFEREQAVLARLHQTHIVPVHTAGQVGPWQYFAMPYIEGAALHHVVRAAWQQESLYVGKTPTLGELAGAVLEQAQAPVSHAGDSRETRDTGPASAEGPAKVLPEERPDQSRKLFLSRDYFESVARVLADAAEALEHAHRAGILHRDVKPSNLMVDVAGHCWLIDFGLAGWSTGRAAAVASAGADTATDASLTRGPMGTPEYMAPEQYRGAADVRSDVWGLGVTLYELLALRRAFTGGNLEEVRAKVEAAPVPLAELVNVPADLAAVCQKAMHKEPAQRYATASEFAAELRRWLGHHPVQARPAWLLRRLVLWARRNRGLAAALTITLLTITAAIVLLVQSERARADAADARRKEAETQKAAVEERRQAAERELERQELQRLRLTAHTFGWSGEAWTRVRKLAQQRRDDDLRDQAAACRIGMDARRIGPERTNFSAGSVVFDEQGERILTGGWMEERPTGSVDPARVWNSRTADLYESGNAGYGVAAFHNGHPLQVVVKPEDRFALVLWDVDGRKPIRELRLPGAGQKEPLKEKNAPTLAFSPDGNWLAASASLGKDKGTLVVWEVGSGKVVRTLEQSATALAFTPGGEWLAAADTEGRITIWPLPQGGPVTLAAVNPVTIYAVVFGRDPLWRLGEKQFTQRWLLAAGDAAGGVTIWDLEKRVLRTFCRGSDHAVYAVAFSPDGMTLASAGRVCPKLWDVASGQLLLNLKGRNWMTGVAFSPSGGHLVVSSWQAFGSPAGLDVYRLEPGREVHTLRGPIGQVERVWFSPDGRRVAAVAHDWRVGVWDWEEDRLVCVLEAPAGWTAENTALAFSPDGKRLAYAAGTNARLWDLDQHKEVDRWEIPKGVNDHLVFTADGKLLLARLEKRNGDWGGKLAENPRRYRVRSLLHGGRMKPLVELADLHWHGLLVSEGTCLIAEAWADPEGQGHTLAAHEIASNKRLWTLVDLPPHAKASLILDPTGTKLAFSPSAEPQMTLLEVPSGRFLGTIPGANSLSPEAQYWSCGGNNLYGFELHRRADRERLVTLGIDAAVNYRGSRFSPKGNRFAWGTQAGTVHVCDLNKVRERLAALGLGW